jgi:hypothetical protein
MRSCGALADMAAVKDLPVTGIDTSVTSAGRDDPAEWAERGRDARLAVPSKTSPAPRKDALMIVSLLTVTVVCLVLAGSAALYLLPLLIGCARRAPDIGAVAAINILLGWTVLGWAAALAMALRSGRPGRAEPPRPDGTAACRGLGRAPRGAAAQARLPATHGPAPAPRHRPGPGRATVTCSARPRCGRCWLW